MERDKRKLQPVAMRSKDELEKRLLRELKDGDRGEKVSWDGGKR